ncbi:hypothetical protein SRABI128_06434 [Microbacterium sp. Bi128]|nr:hypothetical protein SRABI128_06434 [Microbacterium sp. Bi128]
MDALPGSVTVDEVLARCGSGPGQRIPAPAAAPGAMPGPAVALVLGVGGDELRPQGIQLPSGGVLAVLGGPGSGKSTLLAALPGMNPACAWLAPRPGTASGQYWSGLHASALAGTLDRTAIALADDADLLSPEANRALASLNSLGWRVILTAGFGPGFGQRVDLAAIARGQGRAVLIRPRGLMDSEPFGVRFEPEHSPPPGRAVVISDGRATPVQLAALRPAGRAALLRAAGAPVRSWVPYQTAATSSAVASSATTTAMTTIPRGRTRPLPGASPGFGSEFASGGPPAFSGRLSPGFSRGFSPGFSPAFSRGSSGFTGGLDTLAHYRT